MYEMPDSSIGYGGGRMREKIGSGNEMRLQSQGHELRRGLETGNEKTAPPTYIL